MNRRHFIASAAALGSSIAAPTVWSQTAPRLTPLKFTLDFRVTGQTAPFEVVHRMGSTLEIALVEAGDLVHQLEQILADGRLRACRAA